MTLSVFITDSYCFQLPRIAIVIKFGTFSLPSYTIPGRLGGKLHQNPVTRPSWDLSFCGMIDDVFI